MNYENMLKAEYHRDRGSLPVIKLDHPEDRASLVDKHESPHRFHNRSLSNVKSRALFRSNRSKEAGILGANQPFSNYHTSIP